LQGGVMTGIYSVDFLMPARVLLLAETGMIKTLIRVIKPLPKMAEKHGFYSVMAPALDIDLRYLLYLEQKGRALLRLGHRVFLIAVIKVSLGVNYPKRAFMP